MSSIPDFSDTRLASSRLATGIIWAGRAQKTHYRYLGIYLRKRQEERVGQTGDFDVSSLPLSLSLL